MPRCRSAGWLAAAVGTLALLPAAARDAPEAIDPAGKPAGFKAGLSPRYAVWTDKDGWHDNIQYGTPADGSAYTLRSFGKDGAKNGVGGPTTDFNCDLVFEGGQFTAYPQGIQT